MTDPRDTVRRALETLAPEPDPGETAPEQAAAAVRVWQRLRIALAQA